MSPDSEDTALEEALRDDLPSPETSARVRRRLLAAGLAVGNGVGVEVGVGVQRGMTISWPGKIIFKSWSGLAAIMPSTVEPLS